MINLSNALRELLSREHVTAHLLRVDLDSASIYLTDAPHDITYGGITYQGGILQKVPSFNINGEVKVGDSTFTLNSVSSDITALFFQQPWINRPVSVHRLFLELDMTPVSAINVWQGLLTDKGGDESTTGADLVLTAASVWADFSAERGRRTNHNSQQIHFPGDNGFEFCGTVQNNLDWGQKSKSSSSSGGGSRGGGTTASPRYLV